MEFSTHDNLGLKDCSNDFITKFDNLYNLLIRNDPAIATSRHFQSAVSAAFPSLSATPQIIRWAWWKLFNALPADTQEHHFFQIHTTNINGDNISAGNTARDIAYNFNINLYDTPTDYSKYRYSLRIARVTRGITNAFAVLDTKEAELPRLKDLELPFIQSAHHKLRLYRDNLGNIIMVTNQIDEDKLLWKYFGMLPVFFPIIKEFIQKPENETFATIFKAFYDCTPDLLIPFIEEDTQKIEELQRQKDLARFKQVLTNIGNRQITTLRDEVASLQNNVDSFYKQAATYEASLITKTRQLTGLEIIGVNIDQAAIDFLYNAKNIKLIRSDTNYIVFKVTTPITNYVPKDMESYYRSTNYVTETPWLAALLKETFITGNYQFVGTTTITVPVSANSNWQIGPDSSDVSGNPHLTGFQCFSAARTAMQKFIQEGRILDMLNQLIATCASFNVVDGAVMRYLTRRLKEEAYTQQLFQNIESGKFISAKDYHKAYVEAQEQ